MTLRRIPLVDARSVPHPAAFAAAALPEEVARILGMARQRYGAAALRIGDAVSRRWLARNTSPLAPEIAAVAATVARPGAHLLNLSYEWGCTCGVRADDAPVLLRVLDWDLPGLGETLSVIRQSGPAGAWLHIGWPGLAAAITALAPGRHARMQALLADPVPQGRLELAGDERAGRVSEILDLAA